MVYYIVAGVLLMFFWCRCMAINVIGVQYNDGLLSDIILLTQCYFHRGTRLNATWYEEVSYLQPLIPPVECRSFGSINVSSTW